MVESRRLVEREHELATIDAMIARAAAGHGAAILVRGPAGIGKTRLLERTRAAAAGAGMRVLTARCAELERDFAFGVVRELLEPAVRSAAPPEREQLLAGAAGLARPVLDLAICDPADGAVQAAFHGLYWLTVNLTDGGPVALLVDDAHWADGASLRALAYVLRRAEAVPLLVALAHRAGEPGADFDLLDAVGADPLSGVLEPAPLSPEASAIVVRDVFGEAADPHFCTACHEASGGNPQLLDALLRTLHGDGVAPSASSAAQVDARAPAIVATFVLPRLRRLPAPARALARALALLGPATPVHRAGAVAGLSADRSAAAADQLVAAELVAPSRSLEFVHPLIGEAIAAHMLPGERDRGHLDAARELAADAAAAESVAAHLLQVEPRRDVWIVERLRDAARTAIGRGVPGSAVRYLRRAIAEPAGRSRLPQLLAELGSAELVVDTRAGFETLDRALGLIDDPEQRASIVLTSAAAMHAAGEHRRAVALLGRGLAELRDVVPDLAAAIEVERLALLRSSADAGPAAVQRLEQLRPLVDPGSEAGFTLRATLAAEAAQDPRGATEAARSATDLLVTAAEVDMSIGAVLSAAHVLIALGRLDVAAQRYDLVTERALTGNRVLVLGALLMGRSTVAFARGAIHDAVADAVLMRQTLTDLGASATERFVATVLISALVERAELTEAEAVAEHCGPSALAHLHDSIGRLRLAQGRADEAAGHFLACGARLAARRWQHPGLLLWQAEAAVALHISGRAAEARTQAQAAVELARRFDAPIALGAGLRAQGLLTDSPEILADSVAVLARTQARLEHARSLVELGAALRRHNQRAAARVPLRTGLDIAQSCGGLLLASRASDELHAAGARPRRRALRGADALTPSERRVAQLAAGGRSNRQVAQQLFVTVKTVELHLSSVYRKLGVGSRAGLPAALGPTGPAAAPHVSAP